MSHTVSYASECKKAVRRRADGQCERCGKDLHRVDGKNVASVHHRLPRREPHNGYDCPSNMTHLCNECHREIHQNEQVAALYGWIVWGDPLETPFLLRGKDWVMLLPNGLYRALDEVEAQHVLDSLLGVSVVA